MLIDEEIFMAEQLKVIEVQDTTRFYFVPGKPPHDVEASYFIPRQLKSAWQTDAVEEAKKNYGPGIVLKAVATIEKASE